MDNGYKEYALMHMDAPVASITVDQTTGSLVAVGKVCCARHLPLGVSMQGGAPDRRALNDWWIGRSIPASRAGLRGALEAMNISLPQELIEKCLGLSLSDTYWIRPKDSSLCWKDVNFFENPFSRDVGEILFGGNVAGREIDLMSPDNTSDGWLGKRWFISEGKRYLMKGGSGATRQEPYNEVIASRIARRLNIPHVEYALHMQEGNPCCVCEDFISRNTDYVSAWYVMRTAKRANHVSLYNHYVNCCKELGIADIEAYIAQQIVLDYIIANEDRHQGNFGIIRNAQTLEVLSPAPIFDSGSSLWFSLPVSQIRESYNVPCKPFAGDHEKQLKLARDFTWLNTDALDGLGDIIMDVFVGSEFVDAARAQAIARAVSGRAGRLKEFVRSMG